MSEYKQVDMIDFPTRGRTVFIEATVADLRRDRIICRNKNGYFYSVTPGEVYVRPKARWMRKGKKFICPECGNEEKKFKRYCSDCGSEME